MKRNLNNLIERESQATILTPVEVVVDNDDLTPDPTYTLYATGDVEVYIEDTGSVYTSQSAMARMLGMQQGHLSSVLKRGDTVADMVNVTVQTAKGTTAKVSLYGVNTLLNLAVKYCPTLAAKFAEMGATMYLYQIAGYKVAPKSPETPKPPSGSKAYNDYMETAHEALGKLLNLHRFAEDKPGLESYLRLAEAVGSKSLGGKMTLDEMADSFGITVEPDKARLIGRAMAGVSRSQEEEEPTMIRKRVKNSAGNHQSYFVTEFSVDYLPLFESLCRAYKLL
jgi:hypothetical protein